MSLALALVLTDALEIVLGSPSSQIKQKPYTNRRGGLSLPWKNVAKKVIVILVFFFNANGKTN